MKATFRITAIAPTAYQYQSCRLFGHPEKMGNGSFVFQQDFETEEEAKKYLIERAEGYFENQNELDEAIDQINEYGSVTLDAVTGYIKEVEEA